MQKMREWETRGSLFWNDFNGNVKEIEHENIAMKEIRVYFMFHGLKLPATFLQIQTNRHKKIKKNEKVYDLN